MVCLWQDIPPFILACLIDICSFILVLCLAGAHGFTCLCYLGKSECTLSQSMAGKRTYIPKNLRSRQTCQLIRKMLFPSRGCGKDGSLTNIWLAKAASLRAGNGPGPNPKSLTSSSQNLAMRINFVGLVGP